MGFIFNNIAQLANHLVNESESKAQPKNSVHESSDNILDFASVLGSAQSGHKSKTTTNGQSQVDPEFETKERIEIPASIVKAAISNNKDKLTILISAEQLSGLLAKFNLSQFRQVIPDSKNRVVSGEAILNMLPGGEPLKLSFNPSDLFDAAGKINVGSIPVELEGAGASSETKIDVKELMNLIGEFPDPIEMEISESFSADELSSEFSTSNDNGKGLIESFDTPVLKSSFTFDLKEIAKNLDNKVQTTINGILTQSQKAGHIDNSAATIALMKNSGNFEDIFSLPTKFEKPSAIPAKMANTIWSDMSNPTSNVSIFGSDNTGDLNSSRIKNNQQFDHFVKQVNTIFKESLAPESAKSVGKQFIQSFGKDIFKNNGIQIQDSPKVSSVSGIAVKAPEKTIGDKNIMSPAEAKSDSFRSALDSNRVHSTEEIHDDANNILLKPEMLFAKNSSNKILSSPKIINAETIKSAILHAASNNLTSLKLRLHPESLGNIDIRMIWKNDAVSISIKADTTEAARIMTSNLADLKSGLENANFKISEISVVLDNSRNSNNYNHENREFANSAANGGGHQRRSNSEFSNQLDKKHESEFLSDSREEYNASVVRGWIDLKA